jgi:hypothetical protein
MGDLARAVEHNEQTEGAVSEEKTGHVHSYLSRFSFTDIVVLVVNECLGVPLCIAGGENFAHTDWVGSAIGWGVGIPLCVSGVTFPFWRGHVKTVVATWIEKRWQLLLPVAVLLAFVYAVGPVMYRRATAPVVTAIPSETGFTQQQVDAKVANAVANLNTQLTEANRQRDAAIAALDQERRTKSFESRGQTSTFPDQQRIDFENALRYRIITQQVAEKTQVRIYADVSNELRARALADMLLAGGFSPIRDSVGNLVLRPDFNIKPGIVIRRPIDPSGQAIWMAIRTSMSQAHIPFEDGDPITTDVVRLEVGS